MAAVLVGWAQRVYPIGSGQGALRTLESSIYERGRRRATADNQESTMAKMFYSLQEAAVKLGVVEDEVRAMAASGKLQQFRDRDKLMFKRDQIDSIAGAGSTDTAVPLADSGDTDALGGSGGDSRQATGISVFDAGEIEPADPAAQTQVTQPTADDEELALEGVGSGSGLLDLTRESDDTSLGAELLDEIYPGSGDSAVAGSSEMESAVGSSGVFESALGMESAGTAASGIESLQTGDVEAGPAPLPAVPTAFDVEPMDPAGSGLGAGLLLGSTVALIVGLIVAVSGLIGVKSSITTVMTETEGFPYLGWMACLLVVCFILGGIGYFMGKAGSR